MKKLLAFLTACATMSCIFASCGNNEEEENTSSKESSVSNESSEETTAEMTEEQLQEETTAEIISEETTTELQEETVPETVPETSSETISETVGNASSEQSFLIGKWQCEKVIDEGRETKMLDDDAPAYALQFDFKDDGTIILGELISSMFDGSSFTWNMTMPDNVIEVKENGRTSLRLVVEGDYLVGNYDDDEKIYLSKVDEFKPFGGADPSAFVGKWEGEKAIVDGRETTVDDDNIPVSAYQFDFKEDGRVGMGEYLAGFNDENRCFWDVLSDNQIVLFINNDSLILTVDGNYLVATEDYDEIDEDKIYLKRVDEFQSVS